jgi:glycerate 2-kinase
MKWKDPWEDEHIAARPRAEADSQGIRSLLVVFRACVDAARPESCLPSHLPPLNSSGRHFIAGIGKGGAEMARVAEEIYGNGCYEGIVVTKVGHGYPSDRLEVHEGGHPVPDMAGIAGARRLMAGMKGLMSGDRVIALISGGGSSLLSVPPTGMTLAEVAALNRALLASGADIQEMNTVRRHISPLANGGLARCAFPAEVTVLAISDVAGDDIALISSGPFTRDSSGPDEALDILDQRGILVANSLRDHLRCPSSAAMVARVNTHLIASPGTALRAAEGAARKAGYDVVLLGDDICGESRVVAEEQACLALRMREEGRRGVVLLSGGETTVTLSGKGSGGSNREFALGLAIALNGTDGIRAVVADTDGTDGEGSTAGASVGPDTLLRARQLGLEPGDCLIRNDSGRFFQMLGDDLVTGPTMTNVNDFRAILID